MTLFEPLTAGTKAEFDRGSLAETTLPLSTTAGKIGVSTLRDRLHEQEIHGRGFAGRLALALILVDLVAIAAGFGVAALAADGLRSVFGYGQISALPFLAERSQELMLLAGLSIGIFAFGGLYRRSSWELDEIRRIVAGVGLVALFDATLQFALRDHNSRLWFMAAYPMVMLSVISLRMTVRGLPQVRQAMTSHIVLLGTGVAPDLLIYEMRESRAAPVKLLRNLPLSRIIGRDPQMLDQLIDRLARHAGVPAHRVAVVIAPTPDEIGQAQEVIGLLQEIGRTQSIVLPFTGLARNGVSLQKVVGADMVMAEIHPKAPSALQYVLKRSFDLISGLLVLAAVSPVLLIISTLLALTERGPVFFRQLRVGKNGKDFWCYKFRSMRTDAQERLEELLINDPAARAEWAATQKLQNDPRITKLGHFLRRTSLDELPQIFNVLTGEMSLVGPRPIISPTIDGYPGDMAYFHSPEFRYYVRCTPGITGLWQVSGRSDTRHEERVRLDRWYARNWSVWLDLMILFKTVRVVLFGKGSA
ncbi:MAG: sugar transferase [Pseudomonadota bacterium]